MKYFATFDNQGNVTGHYCEEIHSNIPSDAVEISTQEWELSCQGKIIRDIKNKKWNLKPEPTKIELLNQEKLSKKYEINNIRETKIKEGVTYQKLTFDSDEKSVNNLTQILTTVKLTGVLSKDFTWRTKDNQNIPANEEFLSGLLLAMNEHKNECYKKSWELKEKVEKAKTIEEVTKIQW